MKTVNVLHSEEMFYFWNGMLQTSSAFVIQTSYTFISLAADVLHTSFYEADPGIWVCGFQRSRKTIFSSQVTLFLDYDIILLFYC